MQLSMRSSITSTSRDNIHIYYELCDRTSMPSYPFFTEKLITVQKLTKKKFDRSAQDNVGSMSREFVITKSQIQSIILPVTDCTKCNNNKFFQLGNIIWSGNMIHKINTHQSYPSEYFIKVIINCYIIDNMIINPPIELPPEKIEKFMYIPLKYNLLLILDALWKQGSKPRYIGKDDQKYIYSEHSGVLSLKNNIINNIIISTETNRLDPTDDTIYLPINTDNLDKYEYLFHTHPNTLKYAGRISEGVIYEFPSANDILNFIKYHDEGRAQASLIIAPEGMYVIRPIKDLKKYDIDMEIFYHLRKFIMKLEKIAIKKFKVPVKELSDPDIFHAEVGSNFTYINSYNKFIEPHNLLIEFYPREKKNGEWSLRPINLPLIN